VLLLFNPLIEHVCLLPNQFGLPVHQWHQQGQTPHSSCGRTCQWEGVWLGQPSLPQNITLQQKSCHMYSCYPVGKVGQGKAASNLWQNLFEPPMKSIGYLSQQTYKKWASYIQPQAGSVTGSYSTAMFWRINSCCTLTKSSSSVSLCLIS